jgi:hypothetical protein
MKIRVYCIPGFHAVYSLIEVYKLLDERTASIVRPNQIIRFISHKTIGITEKISGFHSGDYEECHLLGSGAV